MDLLEIMRTRRSIRVYSGEVIPDEKLKRVLQAGLLSPSGKNTRPWEFVVVRDKETLLRMSECRVGAAKFLKKADCAIVVVGDSNKTDTVIEDCSIAMANMHLMAHALGLGSCWIQGRLRQAPDGTTTEETLRRILGFPEQYHLEAILSLGVPGQGREVKELPDICDEKIHNEHF